VASLPRHTTRGRRWHAAVLYLSMALGKAFWVKRSGSSPLFLRRRMRGTRSDLENSSSRLRHPGNGSRSRSILGYVTLVARPERRSSLLRSFPARGCGHGRYLYATCRRCQTKAVYYMCFVCGSGSLGVDSRLRFGLRRAHLVGVNHLGFQRAPLSAGFICFPGGGGWPLFAGPQQSGPPWRRASQKDGF
jgi:hypothetical protein